MLVRPIKNLKLGKMGGELKKTERFHKMQGNNAAKTHIYKDFIDIVYLLRRG